MIVTKITLKEPHYVNGQVRQMYRRVDGYEIWFDLSVPVVCVQHKGETVAAVFPICHLESAMTEANPLPEFRDTLPAPPSVVIEPQKHDPRNDAPEPEPAEITRVTRRPTSGGGKWHPKTKT